MHVPGTSGCPMMVAVAVQVCSLQLSSPNDEAHLGIEYGVCGHDSGLTCQACLTCSLRLAAAQQRKVPDLPAPHACCALESHSCHLEMMSLLLAEPQTRTARSRGEPAAAAGGWQQHLRQQQRPAQRGRLAQAPAAALGAYCSAAQKTCQHLGVRLAAAEQTSTLAAQQALPGCQQQQQDCLAAAGPGQAPPRSLVRERRQTDF